MDTLEAFAELGVSQEIMTALSAKGFTEPTPIQKLTIPILLSGEKDVVGQAQTGTGKTAAFGIPIIQTLTGEEGHCANPRALILTPTRELCIQVAAELNSLKGTAKLRISSFYGGQFIGIQLGILHSGVDVIVGTPGRILDLLERKSFSCADLKFAVLDEADEMLDMGFIDDVGKILAQTPSDRRMLMFSATMPKEILRIAEQFMRPGYEIEHTGAAKCDSLTKQIYFEVRREYKLETLIRIIEAADDMYAMVFCRTRTDADDLAEALRARSLHVDVLHGDIAQAQRTRVISNFKDRKFQLLIATDVAARGIDVNDLTHVINYSIPESPEAYVHRIGRTGRAGKTGIAVTLVTPGERRRLAFLKKSVAPNLEKGVLPTGAEVAELRKNRVSELLQATIEKKEFDVYDGFAAELMALAHPARIISALLRAQYGSSLEPARDIAEPPQERVSRGDRGDRGDRGYRSDRGDRGFRNDREDRGYRNDRGDRADRGEYTPAPRRADDARIRFEAGKADGFGLLEVLELIHVRTGIPGSLLGKVDCAPHFVVVNADRKYADKIMRSMKDGDPAVSRCDGPVPPPKPFKSVGARRSPKSGGYARKGKGFGKPHRSE